MTSSAALGCGDSSEEETLSGVEGWPNMVLVSREGTLSEGATQDIASW